MGFRFVNFFRTRLDQSILAADTTAYIDPDDGDLLSFGVGDEYRMVLWAGDPEAYEIIDITAESAGALTIQRGLEGTVAQDWPAGTRLEQSPTAAIFEQVINSVAAIRYEGSATGTNDYTVTVSGTVPSLSNSEVLYFDIPNTNTGAVRVKVINGSDDTGWVGVKWPDDTPLEAGEFAAGFLAVLTYHDGVWNVTTETSYDRRAVQVNRGPLGNPNRCRNGRFDYWNNGTSFSTPASLTEVCDGYYVQYDGTIGAFTVSRQAFTLGQTDVPGNPKYFARWDQSAAGSGSTLRRFATKLPDVTWRSGEDVIRKVWMKADAPRNVTARILQNFGSGGSPSAEVDTGNEVWALTTSWQAFDITALLPSVSGKTLGTSGDGLILALDLPVNVTMTIDFAMDQFEPGEVSSRHNGSLPLGVQWGGTGGSDESVTELATRLAALVTGSAVQAWDEDLDAIAALSATGLIARTGAGTVAARTLTAGSGISVSNGDGVSGNPTVALDINGLTDAAAAAADLIAFADASDSNNPKKRTLTNLIADLISAAVLGTAAQKNTGTSGDALPLCNSSPTFSGGTLTVNPGTAAQSMVAIGGANNANTYLRMDGNAGFERGFIFRTGSTVRWKEFVNTVAEGGANAGSDLIWQAYGDAGAFIGNALSLRRSDMLATFGGLVLVPAGSAAAPSVAGSGDPNTGIKFPGSDALDVVTGGSVRWQFNAVGVLISYGPTLATGDGTVSFPGIRFAADQDNGIYRIGSDNLGLSLGGALAVDFSTSRVLMGSGIDLRLPDTRVAPTGVNSVGYRGAPVVDGNAAYAFPAADAGCTVYHDEAGTRTYTIPANASVPHPIGTMFIIDNTGNAGAAGAITLAITSDTLRRGDGTAGTGSRTISAGQVAVIRKTKAQEWVITGSYS